MRESQLELIDLIYPFVNNVKENSLTSVFRWFSVRENLDSTKHYRPGSCELFRNQQRGNKIKLS